MKRTHNLLVAAAAAVVFAASASGAAYIKFDGIDGESTDRGHEKWSDILSVSQTISRPWVEDSATGGRRRGSVVLEDIVCTKELDKSSPKLAEAVCKGTVIPKVEIELTASMAGAQATYYRYELTNVMVTSYGFRGSAGDGTLPAENLSLNFEEIKVTYTEFDATGASKGKVEYSWKVEEGVQ
ncbi:MAG: type VI secretion system tube protein Hcp [Verrucomicrobiales bacterium]|nr:type VI secretion system tube protein Hcp [Verrucomicrobiales bacterium]